MWKDIKNWEDTYQISDSGDVRNKITGNIIKGDRNSSGYFRVCLYDKSHIPEKQRFFRHRLVAEHFIPNPLGYQEINHKDHNLEHNYASNLEWCTRNDNELDSRMFGAKKYRPFMVIFNNNDMKIYDTKPQLANELNISRSLIRLWLCSESNTYKNYNITSIEYI